MSLNDIWLNVTDEIGFYTKDTFEHVPSSAGIYAWFYPLIITSKDPVKFIKEVNTILNYDAFTKGLPIQESILDFAWKTINLNIKLNFKDPNLGKLMKIWDMAVSDERTFALLRNTIMKASIFMPPLYVGKAKSLYRRCHQHIAGRDEENSFHQRFTAFAANNEVIFNKVSDLIFVCIKTDDEDESFSEDRINNMESLVEAIIKYLSKPLYSIR